MKRRPGLWMASALVALVLAGCGSSPPATPSASVADDPGFIHVHGLGINPADDTLYAATHTGLAANAGDMAVVRASATSAPPLASDSSTPPSVHASNQPTRRALVGSSGDPHDLHVRAVLAGA